MEFNYLQFIWGGGVGLRYQVSNPAVMPGCSQFCEQKMETASKEGGGGICLESSLK